MTFLFFRFSLETEQGCLNTKCMIKGAVFLFLKVDFPSRHVPLSPSYVVYISELVQFARVCTAKVSDSIDRNLRLIGRPLQKEYRYHKLLRTLTKFYNRFND